MSINVGVWNSITEAYSNFVYSVYIVIELIMVTSLVPPSL